MFDPEVVGVSRLLLTVRDTSMRRQLFSAEEWAQIVEELDLSARQAEVAALILEDFRDEAISRALGLSKATVRSHIRQMFRRLGATSRVGLAVKIFATFRRQSG